MLPNINLQSGEPVAVELTYTPGAAEIVNPLEGNLALAIQAPPVLENGDFMEGGAGWSVLTGTAEFVNLSAVLDSEYSEAWQAHGAHIQRAIPGGSLPGGGYNGTLNYAVDGPDPVTIHVAFGNTFNMGLPWDAGYSFVIEVSGAGSIDFVVELDNPDIENFFTVGFVASQESQVTLSRIRLVPQITTETLTITALQTQARGTRIPTAPGILYSGAAPADMILIPLDPAIYGLGAAPQRVGLVEFEMQGGRGLSAISAAIVRWRDPS